MTVNLIVQFLFWQVGIWSWWNQDYQGW